MLSGLDEHQCNTAIPALSQHGISPRTGKLEISNPVKIIVMNSFLSYFCFPENSNFNFPSHLPSTNSSLLLSQNFCSSRILQFQSWRARTMGYIENLSHDNSCAGAALRSFLLASVTEKHLKAASEFLRQKPSRPYFLPEGTQ